MSWIKARFYKRQSPSRSPSQSPSQTNHNTTRGIGLRARTTHIDISHEASTSRGERASGFYSTPPKPELETFAKQIPKHSASKPSSAFSPQSSSRKPDSRMPGSTNLQTTSSHSTKSHSTKPFSQSKSHSTKHYSQSKSHSTKPYSQSTKPYSQSSKPYCQSSKPHSQSSKPDSQSSKQGVVQGVVLGIIIYVLFFANSPKSFGPSLIAFSRMASSSSSLRHTTTQHHPHQQHQAQANGQLENYFLVVNPVPLNPEDSLDSVDASQENARDSARDNARDNARENARDKGGPSGNDSGSGVVESGSSQVRAVASSSCSAWNCTCQGVSNLYLISHQMKSFGFAPQEAVKFWGKNKCNTNPPPILDRPVLRTLLPQLQPQPQTQTQTQAQAGTNNKTQQDTNSQTQQGTNSKTSDKITRTLAPSSSVCYFSPTRPGDGRMKVMSDTWAKRVKDNLFFVMSQTDDNHTYVDWDNNQIHVAYRNYVDSSGKVVRDYQPDLLQGWQAPLVAKMMKFWEFLGASFDKYWASRCAWYVRTDDDTWLNTNLLQQRLECMDPDEELNFGYCVGFGVGVFTAYSRAVIRNFAFFIQRLRKERKPEWFIGDIEDRRVGQVLMRFNIWCHRAVRRNGTTRPDYMLWHPDTPIPMRLDYIKTIGSNIGCMTFAHQSRPPVMHALQKAMDSHLEENRGRACPEDWLKKGLDKHMRESIADHCS